MLRGTALEVYLLYLAFPRGVFWVLYYSSLIYVNDLPQSIVSSYPFLFADDTKLLSAIKGHSDTLALQEDLALVEDWCSKWSLSLNLTKCVAMRFSLSTTNGVCQY